MKQHEQARIFLKKAKQDEDLLDVVFASTKVSNEIFGFHAQQAAEKILKALLSFLGVTFQRTHNLRMLMDLLSDAGHALPPEFTDLDRLTPYGTLIRYEEPAEGVTLDRMSTRKSICDLRAWVEPKVVK